MTWILVVLMSGNLNGGVAVNFQEFNSLEDCQKNSEFILKHSRVDMSYCTFKGIKK